MYSHCTTGGWILGNTIDGTQAEKVRVPHAEEYQSDAHSTRSGCE
jgi:threonine dehydrogenase-like Zn-dependent dehydrogenase